MAVDLTDEELTRFGIRLADEGPHAFDPTVEWWNESWFWDWYDAAGEVAGHCRIGLFPAQKRAWVWFFAYERGEWIALEEPRLPLGDVQLPRIAYDNHGLTFAYDAAEPLRSGRLSIAGFGRVVAGSRTGMVLPVGAELTYEAVGAPHTTGRSTVPGHSSAEFDACRFEQPITLRGRLRHGDRTQEFTGRGERDHSWGPRPWNMEWTFLAVGTEALRIMCVDVRIPNGGRLGGGYLHRGATQALQDVQIELAFDHDSVLRPCAGRLAVRAEDGTTFAGRVEPISAAEIDITHTFVPPARSVYRRALVRVVPESGGTPLLGWAEFNYFPQPA